MARWYGYGFILPFTDAELSQKQSPEGKPLRPPLHHDHHAAGGDQRSLEPTVCFWDGHQRDSISMIQFPQWNS